MTLLKPGMTATYTLAEDTTIELKFGAPIPDPVAPEPLDTTEPTCSTSQA